MHPRTDGDGRVDGVDAEIRCGGLHTFTLSEVELQADGKLARPKTIGKVLEGMELRICKEDGSSASSQEIGEICVRGPNIMLGYHGMPDETAAALYGGWLHTGDLGYVDEDDYAYIVDRKKDIIIRGGQNIAESCAQSISDFIGDTRVKGPSVSSAGKAAKHKGPDFSTLPGGGVRGKGDFTRGLD